MENNKEKNKEVVERLQNRITKLENALNRISKQEIEIERPVKLVATVTVTCGKCLKSLQKRGIFVRNSLICPNCNEVGNWRE